ncbi:ATP-binding protein [Candidatus Woesebacteria bacterium]|nr:ATP-binding protein [Candidatus Woesebacteria bacterium]MCB9801593.1 ATP-binding protein [Pseudomonadales bacterium]
MIKRDITTSIHKLKTQFPVLAVTGPRQSGKTTLLRKMFPDYAYYNLENPETLAKVEHDTATFIRENQNRVIIDEVQRVPKLLSYIQVTVDETKQLGSFIISGSANLLLSEKIDQSLAGRAAYITLYPLSNQELKAEKLLKPTMYDQIFTGSYPFLYSHDTETVGYYNQYIATYAERDLKNISNIINLSQFRKFFALLAGRVGQLVNLTTLANDTGVSVTTIENWISILEASYLVFRLQPHFKNFGKRYIKSPKIYFTDTGLACRLLGIQSSEQLKTHYLLGGLFENMMIMEVTKYFSNYGLPGKLFFFRDSNGREIDLVIDQGLTQVPIEIKSSGTFNPDFYSGLKYWRSLTESSLETTTKHGFVMYAGEQTSSGDENSLLTWNNLDPLFALITKTNNV